MLLEFIIIHSAAFMGSGLWISEPHRVLAFGFLYFTATAICGLFSHRWLTSATLPPGADGQPLT